MDQFNALQDTAEGLKALLEDQQESLRQAAELITAEMSEAQVQRLVEHQIKLGGQLAVAAKLAGMGWSGPAGSVHISADESNTIKALQEAVDGELTVKRPPAKVMARGFESASRSCAARPAKSRGPRRVQLAYRQLESCGRGLG